METKKIKCKCGQENELVLIDGEWHYNVKRHGSEAAANGKCFNCLAPLAGMQQPKEPEKPAETETPEADAVDIHELKKKDLVKYANDLGVDLPKEANKAEIIELIEEKEAELAAAGAE